MSKLNLTKTEKKFIRALEASRGKKLTKKQRKFIILHERGHAALRRDWNTYAKMSSEEVFRTLEAWADTPFGGPLFATGNRPEDNSGENPVFANPRVWVLDCPDVGGFGDVPMPDAENAHPGRIPRKPRVSLKKVPKDDGPTGA